MTAQGFHLQALPVEVDAADAVRLERVGLDGVLDDADRVGRPVDVPASAAVEGFTWEPFDQHDRSWFPQGITTSGDADEDDLDGRAVLLVSWYGHGSLGSRISCVDYTDPQRPTYRHVTLVEPIRRRRRDVELRPVRVHAGGIVWYGPYLYVAGTDEGLRVFRIDDIAADRSAQTGSTYVLPQCSSYAAKSVRGGPGMRYSFMSLDRSGETHHLVAGEYGRRGGTHRLTRYALDRGSHLLSADDEGRSLPLELHEQQVERMQGATLVDGTWVVTSSQGEGVAGDLYVGRPGAFTRHRGVLPTGPEDIAYWPTRHQLWSVTEWPDARWVFAMDAAAWVSRL